MDTLQPEILSHIFELLLPLQASDSHFPIGTFTRHRRDILGPLAFVSTQWRDLVYGTPSLWSVVELETGKPFRDMMRCLERAKGAKLDVNLVIDTTSHRPDQDFYPPLRALLDRGEQWRSLIMALSTPDGHENLPPCIPLNLPNLETALCWTWNTDTLEWRARTPSLRTLTISGPPFLFHDCKALRRVVIQDIDRLPKWPTCIPFLRTCEGLETLELHAHLPNSAASHDGGPLELAGLKKLVLSGYPEPVTATLFNHISSPSLTTVILRNIAMGHETKSPFPLRPGTTLSNLRLIRAKRVRLSFLSSFISSIVNAPTKPAGPLRLEVDEKAGTLSSKAQRWEYERLRADRKRLEEDCDEVEWYTEPGLTGRFTTWEEAHGMVAVGRADVA